MPLRVIGEIFRWFWVLMLVLVTLNVVIYRHRLRRFEAEGGLTRVEADRLLRAIALWLGGMMLALGAVHFAAGWASPFCVHSRPLTDPFVLASGAVMAVAWALLAWWMFAAGGAELVSRASPVLQRTWGATWTPRGVRIGTAVVLVAGIVGAVVPRLQPEPLPCELPFGAGAEVPQPVWTIEPGPGQTIESGSGR